MRISVSRAQRKMFYTERDFHLSVTALVYPRVCPQLRSTEKSVRKPNGCMTSIWKISRTREWRHSGVTRRQSSRWRVHFHVDTIFLFVWRILNPWLCAQLPATARAIWGESQDYNIFWVEQMVYGYGRRRCWNEVIFFYALMIFLIIYTKTRNIRDY